ncbi:MAG: tetratricopeptide repeat protein [Thermodesulfobacteriota bacterium]
MDRPSYSRICLPLVLVAAGLLVYSNAFSGPFVFDDRLFIVENDWVKSLGNFLVPAGMRYVGDLSFALNYSVNGLHTFGYHLVNIAIHISNSVLVFFLVLALFDAPALSRPFAASTGTDAAVPLSAAFAVSAIFLVHPMQVQAVTYISQRYASLAALFYLAAVLCFMKARLLHEKGGKQRRLHAVLYAASLASTVLAMKTKEISFTIPFVMLAFEAVLFGSGEGTKASRRALYLAPFFIAALIIPLGLILPELGVMGSGSGVEELMRAHKLEEAGGISRLGYLLTETWVVVTYIRLLFYPVHGGFLYHFPVTDRFFDPAVVASSVALAALILFTAYLLVRSVRARNRWGLLASLGLVWFFVTLSVESSVIPIKDPFNERRMYLPSIGMALTFVSAVFYGREVFKRRALSISPATVAVLLFVVPVLPFSAATYRANGLWNDRLELYASEVAKNPYSTSTHMYLGIEYYERGMYAEALKEFTAAKALNPSSVYIRRTLAAYYVGRGAYEDATRETREIVEIEPGNKEARYNLGVLYLSRGLLDEAEGELKELLKLDAQDAHALRAIERIEEMRKRAGRPGV